MADPTLYLYTSLTAGSSHIITATSRMETILKANKQPFRAIDCATDEKARQLWGRRSKGKKLPGLVKYGQVIADLEQVEDWNEFGELVEQIEDVSDIFGDTPMTDTPLPPPVNTLPPNPLKPIIETPAGMPRPISRTASETKHISIAEPATKKEKAESSAVPGTKGIGEQTPLSLALRQAGVEAAAKAGQKKTAAAAAIAGTTAKPTTDVSTPEVTSEPIPKAAAVPVARKIDPSETTPHPAQTKASIDATLESVSAEEKHNITAAKTPAQLEAEGVRSASVDKTSLSEISAAADTSDVPPVATASETKSTEEQVLDLRRSSSIAKTKSSLAQETSINDIPSGSEDEDERSPEQKAAAQAVANVEQEKREEEEKKEAEEISTSASTINDKDTETATSSSQVLTDDKMSASEFAEKVQSARTTHRGSSLSEAPDDKIKEIERKNTIPEEKEEDEEEGDDDEEDDNKEDDDEEDEKEESEKTGTKSKSISTTTSAPAPTPTTKKDETTEKDEVPSKDTEATAKISTTDKEEEKVLNDTQPQDTKAAEPEDAGKSVGD